MRLRLATAALCRQQRAHVCRDFGLAARLQQPAARPRCTARIDATGLARRKRAGFISEAILDGTGQWVGWADSSKQGSSDQARGADRQRSAEPGLDHAMIIFWTLGSTELRIIDMRWSC